MWLQIQLRAVLLLQSLAFVSSNIFNMLEFHFVLAEIAIDDSACPCVLRVHHLLLHIGKKKEESLRGSNIRLWSTACQICRDYRTRQQTEQVVYDVAQKNANELQITIMIIENGMGRTPDHVYDGLPMLCHVVQLIRPEFDSKKNIAIIINNCFDKIRCYVSK